jgi:hypothetical protein
MIELRTRPYWWMERLGIYQSVWRQWRRSNSPRDRRVDYRDRDRSSEHRFPSRRHSGEHPTSSYAPHASGYAPAQPASGDSITVQAGQSTTQGKSNSTHPNLSVNSGDPSGLQKGWTPAQITFITAVILQQIVLLEYYFNRHPLIQKGENITTPAMQMVLQQWRATRPASSAPAQNTSENDSEGVDLEGDDLEGVELEEGEVEQEN